MPRGGARHDKDGNLLTGRPKGAKNKEHKGWVKVGIKLSSEMADYLVKKKGQGLTKSGVIDEALREKKEREDQEK